MAQQVTSAAAKKQTTKKQTGSNVPPSKSVSEPSLNMNELRELANLVNENGFTDFEFENANIRVRLSKNPAPQFLQAMSPQQFAPAASSSAPIQQTAPPKTENQTETVFTENKIDPDENLHKITSPIVGTFYGAPAPDKEPYVREGSKVSPGTTVCIIEAMKLMNEIQSEISGEVVKIYVENGQPVEFEQPLFGIKK
jgi:acetyl-CoA carboxylase biotin carboxyl carrier protein